MKEEQFERIWLHYWWKYRNFAYRINHNEIEEKEILASMFDVFIQNTINPNKAKEGGK